MQEDNFNNFNENNPYELDDGSEAAIPTTDTDVSESASVNGEAAANGQPTPVDNQSENAVNDETKENQKDIGSDIIRGHINTIILRALYERDKYGYEIMDDIEAKSHGQYSLKQPTLYSALKRLENQGYIKAYWKTDEVSNGGRRKYFTLTESGKEITEKNLAEWEYSRTIIDSLISDRSFDFSQPAPTPVDFHILKSSVSRVPIVKSDEADRREQTSDKEKPVTNFNENKQNVIAEVHNPAQQITETVITQQQPDVQVQPQQTTEVIQPQQQPDSVYYVSQQEAAQAETRRIAHENYLKLISEPVKQPEPVHENIVPNSENVNMDSLIYNNRPETERDYKNLIDGIFRRAITNGSVQTTFVPPKPKIVELEPRIRLVDRGKADGVQVVSSNETKSTYATKTTYNKGLTFLKCSAIVLSICLLEFIFCFVFLNQLKTTWVYPVMILLVGLIQFSVFAVLTLKGYGKNCVRPTTNTYISSCVILTVIAILIISATSFLMNINFALVSDVMKMIVIPSITALNLTVFAVCFKAFIK